MCNQLIYCITNRRYKLQKFNMIAVISSMLFIMNVLLAGGITIRPPVIWTNDLNLNTSFNSDGTQVRMIAHNGDLPTASIGTTFNPVCGFFCSGINQRSCGSFFFAIVMLPSHQLGESTSSDPARVVWCANRDRPVGENATLAFSRDGNLLLRDSDGALVWSTNTPKSKSLVEMRLTFPGRLQLFDLRNASVWDSFDHPTDTWLPGQTLNAGQQLSSSTSDTDYSTGQYFLRVLPTGLKVYVNSNPPLAYYTGDMMGSATDYLSSILHGVDKGYEFLRLESDDHLRRYEWNSTGWNMLEDVLEFNYDLKCAYPKVCGEYGLCTDGQCTCLNETYFKPNVERFLSHGCYPITSISCGSSNLHRLIPLSNVSYFNYVDSDSAVLVRFTNQEQCKQTCLKNCSCKAALFLTRYESVYGSMGDCYLPSQLYSLMNYDPDYGMYNSVAYIKVQLEKPEKVESQGNLEKAHRRIGVLLGSVLASVLVGSLLIGFVVLRVKSKFFSETEIVDDLEGMYGLPTRFTFEELKIVTDNFSKKLGQGGFGSVFEGIVDNIKVAVKRLDNVGQGTKEFLAEVMTIGNVQHIHLVRLIGFCSDKTCRMLVYEYMSNGSLDKWIFYKNSAVLEWKTRVRIITEVAKALAYLHEECRQRIIHLDIKPQNILLDDGFQAKVSDFGLSKLVDREQSHALTTMRGTRGYLAPEWLASKITEKTDVYSFGVVVLEVVCGRRNLDYTEGEEFVHLISLLQDKVKECRMTDILDNDNSDTQLYKEEMTEMIKLSIWCLQNDYTKRPSMTMVVKVLDGSSELQANVNINFTATSPPVNAKILGDSYVPSATHLSGGR